MVFSSSIFLFFFLPTVLILYYVSKPRVRNYLLLLASYFFYAWGEPKVIVILLSTSVFDFWVGNRIAVKTSHRKGFLSLAIAINLTALGYFKYANFFVGEYQNLLELMGVQSGEWQQIALPIGISFFTFQKISYLVDLYRGVAAPAKSFSNYALYVAFFPQLIAGPIVRYHDINTQIESRPQAFSNVSDGFTRFAIGLGKKVLIANPMGAVFDEIFSHPLDSLPSGYLWLGVFAYTLQIYFDFSGYSDMAIGLARMFGFRLLENFNRPYISTTITEFWRRWHISLSNWMRDYLYVPLGGNRLAPWRVYLNLWIVFLISGLWHGAYWNFIVWGAYHGFLLTVEKSIGAQNLKRIPRWIMQPTTFLLIMVGWIFFRIHNPISALIIMQHMMSFDTFFTLSDKIILQEIITPRGITTMIVGSLIALAPVADRTLSSIAARQSVAIPAAWVIFLLSILSLVGSNYNPFIYFRF